MFGTPFSVALLVTMLTGLPLCDWTIVATCHPRVHALPLNGSWYVALRTNRCRASKSERPYWLGMS